MSGTAGFVCAALRGLGYSNVYDVPPSVRVCCEPVVLCGSGLDVEARFADGSARGKEKISVLACCDDARDAESTCRGVWADVRGYGWAGIAALGGWRVVSVTAGLPTYRGRDGSGRWLWGFEMDCTVVVEHG